jgi:putative thioredoxin
VVVVTHDGEAGARLGRVVTIRDGRVGAQGRNGQDFAVVAGDGTVQLPPKVLDESRRGRFRRRSRARRYGDTGGGVIPKLGVMTEPRQDPIRGQSIFTRGAVDLGALRAPAAPASTGQAAAGPAGGAAEGGADTGGPRFPGGTVAVDVTTATFQRDVVERSMTTPVVLEFVASGQYAGDPALERFAADGSFVLARSDVRADPQLAQALRIQSLPTIFAFVGGQPVDGLPGQLPEAQLRQWLDAVLRAGGVEVEQPADPRLDEADDALMMGDLDAAERAYQKILSESPRDAAAEAGLAQVGLAKRLTGVEPQQALAEAEANPDDIAAQMRAADVEVLSGQADQAYARLVSLVRRVYGDDREKVRLHLVSLFTVAGPDDPAVVTARRALASALY